MLHLDQCSKSHVPRYFSGVREPLRSDGPQIGQFVIIDIVSVALGEAEQENCEIFQAPRNQRPVTASATFAPSRHPLFDDASAEVSIDEPAPCPLDCLDQARIGYALTRGESGEQPRLENPHDAPQHQEL
jgi:hypothetical protein